MAVVLKKSWAHWWEGMRLKMFKAGAESVATSLSVFMGTNSVASLKIEALSDIGMSWKTALAAICTQFIIRVVYAGATYVAENPDAPEIETEVETVIFQKTTVTETSSNQPKPADPQPTTPPNPNPTP